VVTTSSPPSAARTRAALLAGAAAAPFAAGRLATPRDPDGVGGVSILCPFRATTGLPCPICGSTRGVTLAAHGDGAWADYNAVVVVLLVLLFAYAAFRLLAPGDGPPLLARGEASFRAHPLRWLLALGLVAWSWTLSHRETIVS
jgi:hypothetical protein